jgi:hypothetical protein
MLKVALITIGKCENLYAVEWVEHYKQLGINHIYIIDNNFDNEEHLEYFEDVLTDYINDDFVSIFNHRNETECQVKLYKKYYYQLSNNYDWLCFFDFDEFLILNDDNDIQSYLQRECFYKYNQILINWKIYTDNDLVYYDDRPCLERFTTPMKTYKHVLYDDWFENQHVKPIIRTKLNDVNIFTPHNFYGNMIDNFSCNNRGDIQIVSDISYCIDINYDLAYIKHFTTKTIDEYVNIKLKRGTPDRDMKLFIKTYPFERFFKYNNITPEKLQYLSNLGYDVSNITNETCHNWYVQYD